MRPMLLCRQRIVGGARCSRREQPVVGTYGAHRTVPVRADLVAADLHTLCIRVTNAESGALITTVPVD